MSSVTTRMPSLSHTQRGVSHNILILFAIAIVVTAVISMIFAHKFGYYRGYQAAQTDVQVNADGVQMTAHDIQSLSLQVDILQKKLETALQERDISLNNSVELRQLVEKVEIKNLQLRQVNDVYAKSLAEQGGMPLQIIAVKMAPLPENAFEYRFDVAMLAKNGQATRLRPKLTLLDETSLVEVPLEPRSYDIKGVSRIRGRFKMPDGFKPRQAKLSLEAGGESVEQLYNWKLSKQIADMPLSLAEVPEPDQRPIGYEQEE